jgi:CheY-like chemotaxis protein
MPSAGPLESPKTVLLVEDDPQVRMRIHTRLESQDYNLLEACDGVDAMVIAENPLRDEPAP